MKSIREKILRIVRNKGKKVFIGGIVLLLFSILAPYLIYVNEAPMELALIASLSGGTAFVMIILGYSSIKGTIRELDEREITVNNNIDAITWYITNILIVFWFGYGVLSEIFSNILATTGQATYLYVIFPIFIWIISSTINILLIFKDEKKNNK